MRDCPRCGFLNPDVAEYCVKCRFLMGASAPGAGAGPVPEEPVSTAVAFDEPPEWAASGGRLAPPTPNLEDTLDGRGYASGGYGIGGVTDAGPAKPAPGDAFAIMTGGGALDPGGDFSSGPRAGKPAGRRGRKSGQRVGRSEEGTLQGLPPPPDASAAYTPAFSVDRAPAQSGSPGVDEYSAPVTPHAGPVAPTAPPLSPSPGIPIRSPVPKPAPRGRRAQGRFDSGEILEKARSLWSPRYALALVAAIIVMAALIYLAAGAGSFALPGQAVLGAAESAMSRTTYHLEADLFLTAADGRSWSGKVVADMGEGGDFHAVYAGDIPGSPPVREYIHAGGKTWQLTGAGAWSPVEEPMDLGPSSMLGDASHARVVDRQTVNGATSEHLTFSGAMGLVKSLLPDLETTEVTSADAEAWVDPQHHLLRLTVGAAGLEQKDTGELNCRIDITLGGYGQPVDIKPPA